MKKTKTTKKSNPGAEVAKKPEMKVGKILLAKKAAEEKEMKEGKYVPVSERPGTVDCTELVGRGLMTNEEAMADACLKKCASNVVKYMKGEPVLSTEDSGCEIQGFMTENVIGRDPDMPDEVKVCGKMFRATAVFTYLGWKCNLKAISKFMSEIESSDCRVSVDDIGTTRRGSFHWGFVFRMGKIGKVEKPLKKAKKPSKGPAKKR